MRKYYLVQEGHTLLLIYFQRDGVLSWFKRSEYAARIAGISNGKLKEKLDNIIVDLM